MNHFMLANRIDIWIVSLLEFGEFLSLEIVNALKWNFLNPMLYLSIQRSH